jgi:hypothetical protein
VSIVEFLSWLWGERLWLILLAAVPVLLMFALFLNLDGSGKAGGAGDKRAVPPRGK